MTAAGSFLGLQHGARYGAVIAPEVELGFPVIVTFVIL